jgi:hypothetical protein
MRVVLIHEDDHQDVLDASALSLPGAKIECSFEIGNSRLFMVSVPDPTNV